jgi:hypothetical protein
LITLTQQRLKPSPDAHIRACERCFGGGEQRNKGLLPVK